MRRSTLASLALGLGLLAYRPGAARPDGPPVDASPEAARAASAVGLAKAEAGLYRIELEGGPKRPVELQPDSLLQWSNPVAGSIHGSVFVWTDRGCPAAVGSIYKWFSPNTHLGVELHALTPGLVGADRLGRRVWTPARSDVDRKPIPGAPEPADTPAARLRQLRALAKEFSATETTRTEITRELRLLTQPIYRYRSADPEVSDGGLFAMVHATDPEILLMIEARRTPGGARWEFAAARFNSIALRLSHQGKEVWSAPMLPWGGARDHGQPYTLFIYGTDPGIPADGPGA
jgi:hypothetical protein